MLDRLFSESQKSSPIYAFFSTVNWMHALAILVDDEAFTDEGLQQHFRDCGVQRRSVNTAADIAALEKTLMALHNLVSLSVMNESIASKYDIVRLAIITWYYCIYFASGAMVAATSGALTEDHRGTAKALHNNLIEKNWLITPFCLHIDDLRKKNLDQSVDGLRGAKKFSLNSSNMPRTQEDAWDAIIQYLSGTAKHEVEKIEKKVKGDKSFKALNVDDFRTKEAQKIRDASLKKGYVNFLVQCIRYRGKANYRDSIFLSYGSDFTPWVEQLVNDLYIVAEKYMRMSAHYIEKRVEKGVWEAFVDDLESHSRLSGGLSVLKLHK